MWVIKYLDLFGFPTEKNTLYFASKDEAYKDQCVFLLEFIRHNVCGEEDERVEKFFKSLGKEMQDLCNQSKYIEAVDLYIDCAGDQYFSINEIELNKAREIPIVDWETL